MRRALERNGGTRLDSIGVDSWGVDYALIGERGNLLENPYHYRDSADQRRDGSGVRAREPRHGSTRSPASSSCRSTRSISSYAACRATPDLVDAARALVTIPDLLNYWLTGTLTVRVHGGDDHAVHRRAERGPGPRGCSTRSGCRHGCCSRSWNQGRLIGPLQASVSAARAGTPVVAPACHDTASAVASVSASGNTAFLSSGTWSLLGTELSEPIITSRALALNFTNEGGVCGTTRLLKNIGGLWLLQSCRRHWKSQGLDLPHDALVAGAADERLAFRSLIDPDYAAVPEPDRHAARPSRSTAG